MAPIVSYTCRCTRQRKLPVLIVLSFVLFIGIFSILYQNGNYGLKSTYSLNGSDIRSWEHSSNIDKRPHFVLGILSTNDRTLRDASRQTWISDIVSMANELPFRITYKFLLDLQTNETKEEDKIYQDILFLNTTHHGWAVKFGEKLYIWLQYIHKHYPDALFSAKLDDDVYLCVPQLLKRLDSIMSSTLYYGWANGNGNKIRKVDEMFVVIGKDLVERIVNRTFCGKKTCKSKDDLIDANYADVSLVDWISVYDDIDFQPDNKRITHFGRNKIKANAHLATESFCKEHVIFHKSSAEQMHLMHRSTKVSPLSETSSIAGAVTGTMFSGEVCRQLPSLPVLPKVAYYSVETGMLTCDHWAVVTTIYAPSKAVLNMATVTGWCLLIVADSDTPSKNTYIRNIASQNVKYLTIKEQDNLYPFLSRTIPLKHFGRKNIGYMYAIHHKAKLIWDFDDDNTGIININDTLFGHRTFRYVKPCKGFSSNVLNPYPYFGTNETRTWPRGFPLQLIKNETTVPNICNSDEQVNVGVIQSLANKQPDVDAIYRLTREVPFNFKAKMETHRPLVLPKHVYAPFNAQATMWFPAAFRWMPLPISTNGRVSDIWRSYIAQHFMFESDIRLVFSSPYVVQDRNVHTIIKDFNAELDLFSKSKQLVDFLYNSNHDDIVDLYKALYMRNYLDESDLLFIDAWQKTLHAIGQ